MQTSRLPIRTRRTLVATGPAQLALTVFCPLRGESVDIARCRACGHSDGLPRQSEGGPFLCCDAADSAAGPAGTSDLESADLTPIFEAMTRNVSCIEADTATETALRWLLEAGSDEAPVVDPAGRPLGSVSKDALKRALVSDPPAELGAAPATVQQALTPVIRAVPESSSLGRAAVYVSAHRGQELLVLSRRGELVGALTALDLVDWLARRSGYR